MKTAGGCHKTAADRVGSFAAIYIGVVTLALSAFAFSSIRLTKTNAEAVAEVARSAMRDERRELAQLIAIVAVQPPGSLIGDPPTARAVAIAAATQRLLEADIPVHNITAWTMALDPIGRRVAMTASIARDVAFTDVMTSKVLHREKDVHPAGGLAVASMPPAS
ncbi:hypothetical protein G6L08_35305 [Agrobacterium rhizogenes]|nr:hypothetical protein [Rhizobium rhizogenes]